MTTWNPVRQTAEQYVREYLDPNDTLSAGPLTEAGADEAWAALEDVFAADGGTGMTRLAFTRAVGSIQRQAGFPGW
jgi:hypothetical protein